MDPGGRILNLPSAERWETDLERMGGEEVNALCREVVAVAEATLCRGLQDFTSYSAHSLQTWFAEAAEVRRRHCAAFTHNHISISDVESSRLPHLECTSLATACGFGSCFSSWDASSPTKENSASLLDDRSDCTLARRLRIIAKEYKDGRFAWLVNIITDQMLPTLEGVLGKQYEGDVLQRILDVIQPYVGVLEGVLQLPISGAVLHSDSVATVQWLGLLKDAMKEERGYLGSGDIDAALDCTDRVHECLEQLNGVVNSKQISVRQLLVDYEAALGIVYPQLQLSLTATRDTKQNLRDMISAVQSDFASIAAAVIKFEEEDSAMTKQLAERKASAALQIQKIEDEIIALWGQMFQKRYILFFSLPQKTSQIRPILGLPEGRIRTLHCSEGCMRTDLCVLRGAARDHTRPPPPGAICTEQAEGTPGGGRHAGGGAGHDVLPRREDAGSAVPRAATLL